MPDAEIEVRVTKPFKRRLKDLSKRYRQVQKDIQPIITELELGNFVGHRIPGTDYTVFNQSN